MGDRLEAFNCAARMLIRLPGCRDFQFSHLYETEPVDCPEPLPFLNGAVSFKSNLSPDQIFHCLKTIERVLGRKSSYRNAPRIIDLDLLLWGDWIVRLSHLTVPHPRLHQRLFVLAPLADLGPDLQHPVLGKTVNELKHQLVSKPGLKETVLKSPKKWMAELRR